MDYGTMHSTYWSVLWINISIFKVQTIELNRLTRSSYENVLADKILHFLEFFYYFFRLIKSHLNLNILDHSKVVIFYLSKKIVKIF